MYSFFFTISQIIIDCFMKCFCQFLNTLSFEINHSIYSFYFTEKNAVFFTAPP